MNGTHKTRTAEILFGEQNVLIKSSHCICWRAACGGCCGGPPRCVVAMATDLRGTRTLANSPIGQRGLALPPRSAADARR